MATISNNLRLSATRASNEGSQTADGDSLAQWQSSHGHHVASCPFQSLPLTLFRSVPLSLCRIKRIMMINPVPHLTQSTCP